MKELLIRSVFGLVFLAVVFVPYYLDLHFAIFTFPFVLFLFSVIGTMELFRMASKSGYGKKGLFLGLMINTLLFLPALINCFQSLRYHFKYQDGYGFLYSLLDRNSVLHSPILEWTLLLIVAGAFTLFSIQIFTKDSIPGYFRFPVLTSLFYPTVPLATLALVYSMHVSGGLLLLVLLPIYMNDTMAYVSGRLFGKNKMFPSVSPKKTWEGFIGGIIGAFLLMLVVFSVLGFDVFKEAGLIAGISISASILATLGDLFESKLKRTAGVKDSGTILPGHGGILDRIDAMLFVAPILYVLLILIS